MFPQCEEGCQYLVDEMACPCEDVRPFIADMRRYLYRNVACEYRKGFKDFSKMPNVPGWA